jgi:hypothetical protein
MVSAGAIELAGDIVLEGAIELAGAMLLDWAQAAPAESRPRPKTAVKRIRDIAVISDSVGRRRSGGAEKHIGKMGGIGQCHLGMDSMPGRDRREGAISDHRNGA